MCLTPYSQSPVSGPFIFWLFLYCKVKLQVWPMAQVSGMKLSLGISPARPPASQTPSPWQWMKSFLPPTLSLPHFFLGLKGYLQPSCLGPLARVGEHIQLATGVSVADKRRGAVVEGRDRGWWRDTQVHHGLRLTFIQSIVQRWKAPGTREQKKTPHV